MEQTALKTLTDILFTQENVIIMVATWVLISTARKMVPTFFGKRWVIRFLPAAPILICSALVWMPGLRPDMGWGGVVLLGVILGWGSGHMHKLVSRTFLGSDLAVPNSKTGETGSKEATSV